MVHIEDNSDAIADCTNTSTLGRKDRTESKVIKVGFRSPLVDGAVAWWIPMVGGLNGKRPESLLIHGPASKIRRCTFRIQYGTRPQKNQRIPKTPCL